MKVLKRFFLLIRLSHWSKSIFVLFGVIYSESFGYWQQAFLSALAFCCVSSAVYIYNDLHDVNEDRQHPQKSQRPIACNDVSVAYAVTCLLLFLSMGLTIGFYLSNILGFILIIYIIINLSYNHLLRSVPVLDVLCISSGFLLRLLAGTLGIGLHVTCSLILAATCCSLFVVLCKRRFEMQLCLTNTSRPVLEKYTPFMLNYLIIASASVCFTSYLIYTLYTRNGMLYFLLTVPFAAMGLLRFMSIPLKGHITDDPVVVFLSDKLSKINLICFMLLTIKAIA